MKDLKALSYSVPPSDASVHKAAPILPVIHQGVGTPLSTVLRAMTGIVTLYTYTTDIGVIWVGLSLYSIVTCQWILVTVTGNFASLSHGHGL